MKKEILQHYTQTGTYTYPGPYSEYFRSLPEDISKLGNLICSQVIHRVTLKQGNAGANEKLIYGDMTKYPWYRLRCEDDILMTAASMTAELFRLDERGFTLERAVENKLVVTCRYVSVLMSAILKAKGIPCRSRAGFAPYFIENVSMDHWINQYWNEAENRWVTFDADGFYNEEAMGFYQYDMPYDKFCFASDTWLNIRNKKIDGKQFIFADRLGTNSLKAAIRQIFYDFHSLMNNEISYKFQPYYIDEKFEKLTEDDFKEIDDLAKLLQEPDRNFDKLIHAWNTNHKFRILNSPLVGDGDNSLF